MPQITLYTPTVDELDYRIRLLADEDTMSYNAQWSEDGNRPHFRDGRTGAGVV